MWAHPLAPLAFAGLAGAVWYAAAASGPAGVWYDAQESHFFLLPPILADVAPSWVKFSTMDFFGSVGCCASYRAKLEGLGRRAPWFGALATCCIMQFGGTTLVGLLLGQPASWTLSHNAPRSLLLAFWLVFACPGDVFYRGFRAFWPARLFFTLGAAVSSGHAITSWGVDKALNAMHERARTAVFSTLIAGTFGASGGGLCVVALDLWGEGAGRPRTYGALQKAAVGSLVYYILRDPHDTFDYVALSATQARLCIGVYSVIGAAIPELFTNADHLTPHRLLETAIRTVVNVPAYVGAPRDKTA